MGVPYMGVGWLANAQIELDIFSQVSGWKFQKIFELPPPRSSWICDSSQKCDPKWLN